jgi:Zn-finger nucleic acid-binding protein
MNCPRCNSLLKKKEVIKKPYSIYVGECAGCGGWWFNNNELEEYRASIFPTSQYTFLPRFEPITTQAPTQCCSCEQNTLLLNKVGLHIVHHCTMCSGVFISKTDVSELVRTETDSMVDIGVLALIISFFS